MEAPPPLTPAELAANKGPNILATICAISGVSTAFVVARVFVRGHIMRNIQADDWIVIAALFFAWACVGLSIEAVQWGNGRHFAALDVEQKQNAIKYTMFGFVPGIMSFALPKFAAVLLLNRLMNPSRLHRMFLWFLAFGSQILLLGCVVILFAQCSPTASQWNFSIVQTRKCWSPWLLVHYSMGAGSFSAFTDLYLAIYPSVVLFGLQIELRKKIALCIALGIGSIASVVAIYKTTSLVGLAKPDFSWETSELVVWTIIEGQTIIIASCIPLLQPLLDLARGRRTFRSSGGGGSSGYRNYESGHGTSRTYGNDLSSAGRRLGPKRDPDATLLDTLATRIDRKRDDDMEEAGGSPGDHHPHHHAGGAAGLKKSDSQESILNADSDRKSVIHSRSGDGGGGNHEFPGRIVRTHEVTVEYDSVGSEHVRHGSDPDQPWRM